MDWMILIGISTGMRTLTATAVLCWFAYAQLLPQHGYLSWTCYLVSAVVFTLLALGEYVGDTLPQTPNRTAPGPLAARLVFGALAGAMLARGMLEPAAGGVLFGAIGALIGAYGGFYLRRAGARWVGRDRPVAVGESVLALLLALGAAYKVHTFAVTGGWAPHMWMPPH
jgi:uncharacterized membrane protein